MTIYSGIEMNNQIKQINAIMDDQINEARNVKESIYNFIYNSKLYSTAYTNQKEYFNTFYIPLYTAIEIFAKEFINANLNLQRQFLFVDNDPNAYINTDVLMQEIATITSFTNYWFSLCDKLPYAQHYAYIHLSIKDELQNVVDKMNQFSLNSSSYYETTTTYLIQIVNGINALKGDCWNSDTSTFKFESIDHSWLHNLNELNEKTSEKHLKDLGLSNKNIQYLMNLDYSCYEVYTFLSNLPPQDNELILNVLKGNYQDAFEISATGVQEDTYCILSNYMTRLIKHNKSNDLMNFVNAISMSKDIKYKDSNQRLHLSNLIASTSISIEFGKQGLFISDALNMYQDPITDEMRKSCLHNEYLMDIYSLLMSIDYLTTSKSTYPNEHTTGQGRIQANVLFGISFKDLCYDRQSGFTYKYKNQLGSFTEGHYSIYDDAYYSIIGQKNEWMYGNTDVLSDKMSQLSEEYISHLADLRKKKEDAIKNYILNASISVVTLYNPMVGIALKTLQSSFKDEVATYLKNSSTLVKDYANWDDLSKNLTSIQKKDINGILGNITTGFSMIQDMVDLEETMRELSDEETTIRKEALNMLLGQDKIVVKDGTHIVLESIQGDGERAIMMNRWEKKGASIFFGSSDKDMKDLSDLKNLVSIKSSNLNQLHYWYKTYVDDIYIDDKKRFTKVVSTAEIITKGGIDFEYYLSKEGIEEVDIFMDAMYLVDMGYEHVRQSNTGSILSDFDNLVNTMDREEERI